MNLTDLAVYSDSNHHLLWAESMVGGSTELNNVGNIALWVGVLEHAFSTLGFIILGLKAKKETLIFYNINILICAISTYCYLLMATREGDYVTYHGHLQFWPRYFEFTVGTPLLLLDLGLIANAEKAELFFIVVCDVFMMWSGWSAAIAKTESVKWVMFGVSCLFFAPILSTLLGSLRKNVESRPIPIKKLYDFLSLYTVVIWSGYPIIWLLRDGFHLIDLNTECVMHTVIDMFAKDVFGYILISNHHIFEDHDTLDSVTAIVDAEHNVPPLPPSPRAART